MEVARRASSGYAISVLHIASVYFAVGALKGDDKEPKDVIASAAMGSLPVLSQMKTILGGYDAGLVGLDAINDFTNSGSNIINLVKKATDGDPETKVTEQQFVKAIWSFIDAGAMVVGVPEKNFRDDMQLILRNLGMDTTYRRFTDPYSSKELYTKIGENLKKNKPIENLLKQQTVLDTTVLKNLQPVLTPKELVKLKQELRKN